ncbi:MAG: RDD family protein [Zoogloeaceae bacterium]|nr:RDD family protein [Zoogloeaceae bacterium]
MRQSPPLPASAGPAQSSPSHRQQAEIATLRRRLASLIYEALLLLGVLGLTFMVPNLILGVVWQIALPGWVDWLHIYLVLGVYFVWYWRRGGQTLAMQTWKLRLVEKKGGGTVSLGQAWLRYTLAWPSVLFGGLGLAWAIIDPERQFLHDRLAGTHVVLLIPGR